MIEDLYERVERLEEEVAKLIARNAPKKCPKCQDTWIKIDRFTNSAGWANRNWCRSCCYIWEESGEFRR